jgi:16S rRNA (cytosine967-C5)-methyltransferase
VEVAWHRAALVEQSVRGMPVEVICADGRTFGGDDTDRGGFDRVLVDAPCTGLGSLRRRPESRWRRQPDALPPLTRLQRELLTAALRAVPVASSPTSPVRPTQSRPGGCRQTPAAQVPR